MSRKKRDRQRHARKIHNQRKCAIKDVWPALAAALENPAMHALLEKQGLVADVDAIRKLAERGVFIAVSPDGRVHIHNQVTSQ